MARKEFQHIPADTSELEEKLKNLGAPQEAAEESNEPEIEEKQVIKAKKSEVSNIAKEKMEAISKFGLREATIGITAHLPLDADFNFTIIAKKSGKDKKELALQYILKCIDEDLKKIGIFEHKK